MAPLCESDRSIERHSIEPRRFAKNEGPKFFTFQKLFFALPSAFRCSTNFSDLEFSSWKKIMERRFTLVQNLTKPRSSNVFSIHEIKKRLWGVCGGRGHRWSSPV